METSTEYNEDSRRNQCNNHKDGANNFTSQYQQSNYEYHQHIRNIRERIIFNPKQHGRSDISNSKDVS